MRTGEDNAMLRSGVLLGAGKYKIVSLLGSGGFGNTYLAEHVLLGKRVAVKEFFASQFCNRDSDGTSVSLALTGKAGVVTKLRKKFMEEARALAGLNHPGIVRVNDVFEENGTAYYVMDLIEGKALSAIVKERGSLGEKEAVGYIKQVCQALKVVHGKGRLHLDIKPANIMVDGDGHAVLIDFGASKQYDEGSGENTSTFVARTAGYAPLEQGSGSGIKTFSPSTDIYALGATLYKLLSGSTPPDAADLASGEELPPLPAVVSGSTKKAVVAAMSLRRGDRPQSVEEFESLLGSVDSPGSVREEDERTEIAGGDTLWSNSSQGKAPKTGSGSRGVSSSKPKVSSSSGSKKPSPSKQSSSAQPSSHEEDINSGKEKKALIGIIVGFAAVVIALGLVLLFGGNGGGSDDVSSVSSAIEAANTAVDSSVSGQGEGGDKQESQPEAPTAGSMVVNYEPSGATVYVDGTKKGATPCTVSGVSFGTHKVKIVKIGYESAELSVKVSEGSEPQLRGSLEKDEAVQTSGSSASSSALSTSSSSSPVPIITTSISGHEYVDLGLSVKWATCNVGAEKPEEYGNYYAWGETKTKGNYSESNSTTYNDDSYNYDIGGNVSSDAARANWGGSWRLPTQDEWQELIDGCEWEWTTLNGKSGYRVTSRKNGKSIFLRAAGCRTDGNLRRAGTLGLYWSSTPSSATSFAFSLRFDSNVHIVDDLRRRDGMSVRPVSE